MIRNKRIAISKRKSAKALPMLIMLCGALACAQATAPDTVAPQKHANAHTPLDRAINDFAAALQETILDVRMDPAFDNDRHQAAGALYWAQMLLRTIEDDLIQDPDFPLFRIVDHRIREGADNPDQRYLFTPIRGGTPYRVWGPKDRRTKTRGTGLRWPSLDAVWRTRRRSSLG